VRLVILLIISINLSITFASEKKNYVVEDTMITKGNDDVYSIPNHTNSKNVIISLKENSIVYVLEKQLVPNQETHCGIDYFLKIKTSKGQIGYIWAGSLISLKQFRQHNDSLKLWASLPQPLYTDLIGKTYFKDSDLAPELSSGEFISCGEKNLYGIISFSNKYNGNYAYLFFVIEDKRNGDGLKVLDIVRLSAADFKKGSSLWFKQCICKSQTKDCSDVVAIYHHNEEMAKKDIMVKPDKAWRPNYKTQKLELISPETVTCGSIAPEEYDDNGP
jgi:hypothetical protein